jgi:hypothetical protein
MRHENQRKGGPPSSSGAAADSYSEQVRNVSASAAPSEYQSALLQIIQSVMNHPQKIRALVYELSRANLRKEIWQSTPKLTPAEIKESTTALEIAIARVEADWSHGGFSNLRLPRIETDLTRLMPDFSQPQLPDVPTSPGVYNRMGTSETPPVMHGRWSKPPLAVAVPVPLGPAQHRFAWRAKIDQTAPERVQTPPAKIEIIPPHQREPDTVRLRRRVWLWFIMWPLLLVAGPLVFSLALYVLLSGRIDLQGVQTQQAIKEAQQQPAAEQSAPSSGLPLPTNYGIYVVSNQSLTEIELLPIKPPDPRVALSAEITKPSQTVLPDGKVVFIAFRRDLVNNAPAKVSVRAIARIARETTLSNGKPMITQLEASWRMRGISYGFKVSPMSENREMVAMRPEVDDLVLPAGRYALVFNGLGYDFTVDGPITAAAQCLESFEAANGPIFTECRPK